MRISGLANRQHCPSFFMSLNKAIEHKKEYRKMYTGTKVFDCTCRNHGSCEWCRRNRKIQALKEDERTKSEIKEYLKIPLDISDKDDKIKDTKGENQE